MSSVYVHIPFCAGKCRYCDFVSFAGKESLTDDYILALLKDAEGYRGEAAETVFIGGGTPSVLSCGQTERLLRGLADIFRIKPGAEFTMESNPCSLTKEKLRLYRDLGVNRLSVGLQSTLDSELKMLGRLHDYKTFLDAYAMARECFDNINIDLISGLPGQRPEDFALTLDRVTALEPEHISAYSLILEEGTPLEKEVSSGRLSRPDEETDRQIYALTAQKLLISGYKRYEISNYSREGYECRHNLAYWTGKDYIGIGCAAHSLQNGIRSRRSSNLTEYMTHPDPCESIALTKKDRYEEFIMLRLRLTEGFSFRQCASDTGTDIRRTRSSELEALQRGGYIIINGDNCRLSDKGMDLCDAVTLQLI